MHFTKEMFIGKLNFLFTFFLGYALFILANIIQYKIIKSYVIEYKQTNPEIDVANLAERMSLSVGIIYSVLRKLKTQGKVSQEPLGGSKGADNRKLPKGFTAYGETDK